MPAEGDERARLPNKVRRLKRRASEGDPRAMEELRGQLERFTKIGVDRKIEELREVIVEILRGRFDPNDGTVPAELRYQLSKMGSLSELRDLDDAVASARWLRERSANDRSEPAKVHSVEVHRNKFVAHDGFDESKVSQSGALAGKYYGPSGSITHSIFIHHAAHPGERNQIVFYVVLDGDHDQCPSGDHGSVRGPLRRILSCLSYGKTV